MRRLDRNGTCILDTDRYARDRMQERSPSFSDNPYEGAARIGTPCMERQECPDVPERPPLRPCPSRAGCGCRDCRDGGSPNGTDRHSQNGRQIRTTPGGSRCGCGKGDSSLLEELRAVEFALDEIVLYLDAYPCDQAALDLYHHLLERRRPLVERYQAEFGPLTPLGNVSCTKWDWIDRPFPWDYDANV